MLLPVRLLPFKFRLWVAANLHKMEAHYISKFACSEAAVTVFEPASATNIAPVEHLQVLNCVKHEQENSDADPPQKKTNQKLLGLTISAIRLSEA